MNTPRYVVVASPYSTDVRPNQVRDEVTGKVVARMRTAGDAQDWCDLLNGIDLHEQLDRIDAMDRIDARELAR